MDDLKSRRGKITLTKELLFNNDLNLLKVIFGNFYPIHAEWKDDYGFARDLVYDGFSEHFDVIEEGFIAIEYHAEITRLENGTYSIKFTK